MVKDLRENDRMVHVPGFRPGYGSSILPSRSRLNAKNSPPSRASKRQGQSMNKRYKASFKDDLGRSHSMRLEVGCDADEPTHKDAQPLVSHYLAAYGRSLSGVIALKRDKGRKQ
jgi:hypothetical protein